MASVVEVDDKNNLINSNENNVINNLSADLLGKILDKLNLCGNRNEARLVCRIWNDCLNTNCSNEVFNISKAYSMISFYDAFILNYYRDEPTKLKRMEIIKTLQNCQRKNIIYDLCYADLRCYLNFFRTSGDQIVNLRVSICAMWNVFYLISKYCPNVENMIVKYDVMELNGNGRMRYVKSVLPSVKKITYYIDGYESFARLLKAFPKWFPNVKCIKINGYVSVSEIIEIARELLADNRTGWNCQLFYHYSADYYKSCKYGWYLCGNILFTIGKTADGEIDFIAQDKRSLYVKMLTPGMTAEAYSHFSGKDSIYSEEELFDQVKSSPNLKTLGVNLEFWPYPLSFPPCDVVEERTIPIPMAKFKRLFIYHRGATIRFLPIANCKVYKQMEQMALHCKLEGLNLSIIEQMTHLKDLFLENVTYNIFVIICDNLHSLEKLDIHNISDFDSDQVSCDQKNIAKFKNLKALYIPEDVLNSEKFVASGIDVYGYKKKEKNSG